MRGTELLARFSFIFILLLCSASFFARTFDSKEDNYIRAAIDFIANERYEKADSVLSEFKRDFPASPFPYIYLAANNVSRKFNCNSPRFNDAIYFSLSRAETIADSLLSAEGGTLENYYAKALALGYWAYFEGLKENYFSAFDYGSEALDYYDKCLDLDTSFTDAVIANAIYDYWISDKLGWLPFISDKRKSAISRLYASLDKNSYNRNLAVVSLFWILMNEKKYDDAKKIIVEQSGRYPRNRYLLMAYANVEKRFDKRKALNLYKKALEYTFTAKCDNKINEIVLRHKIAMLEFELGNYDNVLEQCDIVLSYKLNEYEKENVGERLTKIAKLKKNAERKKNTADNKHRRSKV